MLFPGFVGPAYTTQSLNASAEELINLYLETLESPSAQGQPVYYGTPGLSLLMTLPGGAPRAVFYQDGRSFAIGGSRCYETTSGAPVDCGDVGNDGLPATMSSNGSAGGQLFIVSAKHGYILNLKAANPAVALIASPTFPNGSALMGAFMDDYFLVLTPTTFQISALTDGTTWSGADVASREIASDNFAAFLVNHRELWLMGTLTSEGWYDNGNASFPFAPISGVFIDQGIAAPWSLARLDNSVAWLAQNRDGTRQVMIVDQLAPRRISTHAVELSLRQCASVSDFLGFSYQEEGHLFYVLTSASNQLTWVCDASERYSWHKRAYWNTVTGQFEAILPSCHAQSFGAHWVGDRASGHLYTQALGVYTDNGNPIRSLRRTPHVNQELHRLVYDLFQVDGEVGVGLPLPDGSVGVDPVLMCRWSDDGGHTYSNERRTSFGRLGNSGQRAQFWRCGSGRNRVWEISMTDPVKRCFTNAYLHVRAGRS